MTDLLHTLEARADELSARIERERARLGRTRAADARSFLNHAEQRLEAALTDLRQVEGRFLPAAEREVAKLEAAE